MTVELEPLRIPITRTLIVAGAIATRDYQDVHHDAAAAKDRGSPDIFMNILTTNGLVGRYVMERMPAGAELRSLKIRLGVPNYPGDEMVLSGTVSLAEGDIAEVKVTGKNGLGTHVRATVGVELPSARPAFEDRAAKPRFGVRGGAPIANGGLGGGAPQVSGRGGIGDSSPGAAPGSGDQPPTGGAT